VFRTHYVDEEVYSGPKFTGLVSPRTREESLSITSFFRVWMSCLVPEIFAIKVGSCVKSVEIFHVFGPKIFLGEGPRFFGLAL